MRSAIFDVPSSKQSLESRLKTILKKLKTKKRTNKKQNKKTRKTQRSHKGLQTTPKEKKSRKKNGSKK